jgi:tetratricopeptide (TPR) repeat protein
MVAREAELAQLSQRWEQARQGRRQVVFITGEAGIGKTTLVDAFVAQVAATDTVSISRGHCIEHYGTGEAYLPLLEVLSYLGRGPEGAQLCALLRQQAPSWLLQLPALVSDAEVAALQRRASGATRERMLRELAEAIEALTAARFLVLVLEDLHWSDRSTLDWLAYITRRRQAARLLLLGTYRPTDAIAHGHPVHTLTQDLLLHGQSAELTLTYLPEAAVAAYVTQRFAEQRLPEGLVRLLHQRTNGNPLFLVTVVDELVRQGRLGEDAAVWPLGGDLAAAVASVPESLRQLIERQFVRLPPAEQALLEAASVAGREFAAATVAAVVDELVEAVESRCATLSRQGQFLQAHAPVDWPDGTVTARYRFRHDLYREFLYERLPVSWRVRWHRQIGMRLEAGYGMRTPEIAAELAEHFGRGRDFERAVRYLRQAGEQAMARSAHREAVMQYEQALQALQQLPETPEINAQAIDLHLALRTALIPLGDSALILTHMRAADTLAQRLGDVDRQGRIAAYWTRDLGGMGHYAEAVSWGQRALAIIHKDVILRMTTQLYLSYTYYCMGLYQSAVSILQEAFASLDSLPGHARLGAALPAVVLRYSLIRSLTELGQFDDGRRFGQEALHIAEPAGHPFSLYQIWSVLAGLYLCQGTLDHAIPLLERSLALCQEADLPYGIPHTVCRLGWAYTQAGRHVEALPCLEQAGQLVAQRQTDKRYAMWLVLLGEAYVSLGRLATAMPLAHEALTVTQERQERGSQGYALRLLGEMAAHGEPPDVELAATHYRQALALAHELGMRPLQAHCHRGLGILYAKTGQVEQADAALSTAVALYRAMAMTFWLPQTEAALVEVVQ